LTLEDIANSLAARGSLQAAFHSFRGTSPMAALRRIRLELAHQTPSASLEPKIAQKEQNRCDYCDN
jgi:hypothetical protein